MNKKKLLVLSGINLFEGGPLSIYYDLLDSIIEQEIDKRFDVIAFVHKKKIFLKYKKSHITFIELPKSRKGYLFRFYYEYVFFRNWSRKRNIWIWISLHDITPNVFAQNRFVYCHNPSIFYKPTILDYKYEIKNVLFSKFYQYIYKINIKKNKNVIVQQCWIRDKFIKNYDLDNVIVSKPRLDIPEIKNSTPFAEYTFIFPSFPRIFKNFEIICEACKLLNKENIKYQVLLTLDGTENRYSSYLYKKYGKVPNIKWMGIQPRNRLFNLYSKVHCMIFPSKLETWGLPISEFKETGKPLIISNLDYAHETIGTYNNVVFFDPNSAQQLSEYMRYAINNKLHGTNSENNESFLTGWEETINFILREENEN